MSERTPETNAVVTRTLLRTMKRDHFIARSGGDRELVMEPYCWCGRELGPEYFCTECGHTCQIMLIACADAGALATTKELVRTNADFRNFDIATLGE